MVSPSTLAFVLLCAASVSGSRASFTATVNNAPIIGILTVPTEKECITLGRHSAVPVVGHGGAGSCFHSLYTKFVESAGARVVPIRYDEPDAQLLHLFSSVNGILFTGGEVDVKNTADEASAQYLHAASVLYNATLAANDAGEHVPIWGTCMGLQTLSILAAGSGDVLTPSVFDAEAESLALDLAPAAAASRMFGTKYPTAAPSSTVLKWLSSENITSNLHHDGVEPQIFSSSTAASVFDVLATDVDRKGKTFIAVIEGKRYPLYATQYHPERPMFEWDPADNIAHSAHAVEASQWHANFFVAEARQNLHRFDDAQEEKDALIYNYRTTGTSSYQAYLFKPVASASTLHALAPSHQE